MTQQRSSTRPIASTARRATLLVATLALASTADASAAGSVAGTVLFTGTAPAAETVEIAQDTAICGTAKDTQKVVVSGDGGLRWAVVKISGGGKAKADAASTDIVQEGCEFAPQVVIARPDQEMGVLNNDNILHNFHTYSEKNAVVNLAQPGFVKRLPLTFSENEMVKVTCDVHSWMEGWVVVTDDKHVAVTDEGGSFSFTDVPAGSHEITVWHSTLGETTATVDVVDGQEATISIELGG